MKIVVLNYTGDRGNWGCQATSQNLVAFLRAALRSFGPLEIVTVPFPRESKLDRLHEAVHGDSLHRLYSGAAPGPQALALLERLVTERFPGFVDQARAADLIVFQGEGTVGPSSYLRGTRLYGLPFLAATLWRKRVVSMNQSLFAKDARDAAAVANIFRQFDLVSVREMASLAFAREIGIPRPILCPDMAFAAHATDDSAGLPGDYFCVSGSAASEFYDSRAFIDGVARLGQSLRLRPVFLYSRANDKDLAGSSLPSEDLLGTADLPHYSQLAGVLKRARFVIGGRYHTAITALAQGTPAILLPGNTFKSEGIGPMLGLDMPVFDITETDAILATARTIVQSGAELRARIVAAIDTLRDVQGVFGDLLRATVAGDDAEAKRLAAEIETRIPERPVPVRFTDLYRSKNTSPEREGGMLERAMLLARRSMPGFRRRMDATFRNLT